MKNFKTALAMENEIFKASDFNFGYNSIMENVSTAMNTVLSGVDSNYVVGGEVSPHEGGGLNLSVAPVFAYCQSTGVCVVEGKTTGPISLEEADSVNDRIDLVQIRGIEQPYHVQARKFIDTSTGNEVVITQEVNTKVRIALDVVVKKGASGHNSAPLVDEGYIKLAEVRVPAGTNNISSEMIKNIDAKKYGVDNAGWTAEKQSSFNPGHLADVMHILTIAHNEDGTIKSKSVTADCIDFGSNSNQVKGDIIPIGKQINIHDKNHGTNDGITLVIQTITDNIEKLYKHSNGIYNRYTPTNAPAVAASVENVDIQTGGERSIDGVNCTTGQIVLLKNQDDPVENGLYSVQTGPWNRVAGYTSSNPDALKHKLILIKNGQENAGKIFYLIGELEKIGVTPLDFRESILSPSNKPGSIMTRDESGRAEVGDPSKPSHIARLQDVNDAKEELKNEIDSTVKTEIDKLNESVEVMKGQIDGDVSSRLQDLADQFNQTKAELSDRIDEIETRVDPEYQGPAQDAVGNRNLLNLFNKQSVQDVMTELSRLCNGTGSATLSGIRIGDFIDLPAFGSFISNENYKNSRIVVSGINVYKSNLYPKNTKNHILWTFKNCISERGIDSSSSNSGGYTSSDMHSFLNGGFSATLTSMLGGDHFIYPVQRMVSTPNGNELVDGFKVFLPNISEIVGEKGVSTDMVVGGYNGQYPIFQIPEYRTKKYNGSSVSWWSASPYAGSNGSSRWCSVGTDGGSGGMNYGSTSYGVVPAFCTC